jgi:glycerol-3-phosphate dehydrogenase (NAD(P)+)
MIGIIGAGSWGTALAIHLSRSGRDVALWGRDGSRLMRFAQERENTRYLPGFTFPESLRVEEDLKRLIATSPILCLAIPLQAYRPFLLEHGHRFSEAQQLVMLSKGMELDTLMLPTQIVMDVLGEAWGERTSMLSGPSFAKEVAAGMPTTVVLSSTLESHIEPLQHYFTSPVFRVYTNSDWIGVELAGALKNVIAIAAGMVSGLNLGHNTMAALLTRALYEISRLGSALGARKRTFSGLAGMGDLILTCTGHLSRNRTIGVMLAQGKGLAEALQELGMVAEGVKTARPAATLGREMGIDLPIINVVDRILNEGLNPEEGLFELMTRKLKSEHDR